MGLMDSLKDFYYKMQDKYYGFLDFLESKGIPVYKAVDALESRNIPSFPIAILLLLLIVLGIGWLAMIVLAPSTSALKFMVSDSEGAISGAAVKVMYGEKEFKQITDNQGVALFTVPLKTTVNYEITKADYDDETGSRLASSSREEVAVTMKAAIKEITKTVVFKNKEGLELIKDPFVAVFSCSGNSGYSETKNVSNGTVSLSIPSNCRNLIVEVMGGLIAENPSVDASAANIEIRLSAAEEGKGAASVFAKDEAGDAITGVEIYLVKVGSDGSSLQTFGPKATAQTGTATFADLPEGIYCFTTYGSQYAEYDSCRNRETKAVEQGKTAEFTVALSKRVVGKVKVIVKDKSSLSPVKDAEVSLIRDGRLVTKKNSDNEGKAEFSIGENVAYDVSVDKLGYLIEALNGINPKEDYYEVLLNEATLENSRSLRVKVVDERKEPVEDARLKLMNLEGTQIGDELTTDLTGIAVFERLEEGTYKIYASKPGYDEKYSDEIAVSGRTENVANLSLNIGRGNIEIAVYDEKEQPLAGATVSLVDFYSREKRADKSANKDGIATFSERADKVVYASVSAGGYAGYSTIAIKMAKDITRKLKINVERSVSRLEIREVGIFVGDEILQKPYSLNPGQSYRAKFKLLLPESSAFDEAGIHLRAGSDESRVVDKDDIYIKEVYGAYTNLRRGTTYNPPLGYSADLKALTSSDAKWANAIISRPSGGVYEMEADIVVKDSAKQQSTLEIKYRAYAKAGGYARDPVDAELGNSEGVATRQGLYANTKAIVASVGPSALCNDDFCSSFMVENLATRIRTYVVDEYSADVQGNYKLLIGNIVKQSEGPVANAELRIEDGKKGLLFGNYSIKAASGNNVGGNANSARISIAAGDIENASVIGGEIGGNLSFVEFSPKREGASEIKISIVSAEGDVVFEKAIRINVSPAKELSVNIVPKAIVPYVQNNILVMVTADDGITPVSDALVTVKKERDIIANGTTDEQGVFAYSLVSPNPGSTISLLVEKVGFRQKVMEVKVSENIIEVLPSTIEARFIIGTAHEIESEFLGRNITLIPLAIEGIELGSEFSDYVTLEYDKGLIGKILDVNSDFNATILLSLAQNALAIEKPKNIEGAINITLGNKDLGKKWVSSIRTIARIGFGDEVDNLDCLAIDKATWKVVTGTDAKSLEIKLANKCSVDSQEVALSTIEGRILGKDAETGKLEISAKEGGTAKIELTSSAQKIISSIAPSAELTLLLEFTPEVSSGAEKLEIEFSAKHYTEKGSEAIKAKITADVAVSILSECIQVNPTSLNLDSCPVNTGYGMYGNNFGNGFNQQGQYNPYDPNAGFAAAAGYGYGGSQNYTNPAASSLGMGYGTYSAPEKISTALFSSAFSAEKPGEKLPLAAAYLQNLYDPLYGGMMGSSPYSYGGSPIYGGSLGYGGSPYSSLGYNNPNAFPNQYYYPQIAGNGFMGNTAMMASASCSDPKGRKVTVTNNCATEVEFSATGDQGLNIADNAFSLKPGESKDVQIEPQYALGSYKMGLSARPKGSAEKMQKLGDVQVNVENELLKGFRDCLSIDPPSTLKFNSFIGKGTYLKVMNSCFNQGIRLPENNSAIDFFEEAGAGYPSEPYGSGFQPNAPMGPLTSAVPNATPADMQKLIDNWAYVGSTYESGADGKVVQIMTFRVIKSVRYQQDAPRFPENTETPFSVVGGLRYFLTKGYYSVKANTMLVVKFFTKTGMQRTTNFPMTIEDYWQAMPYAERVGKYGDPKYTPEQCIPEKEEGYDLDFMKEYPDCIPANELSKVLEKKIVKIAERDPRGNEINGCGSMDRITEILNPIIEKNGLKFLLSTDEAGHSIKVTIRGWEQGGTWNGQHTIVEDTVRVKFKRAFFHTDEKLVSVKLKICVKGKEGPGTGPGVGEIKVCPEGVTGTGTYTAYGFDRLLLDWEEPAVNKDTCDALKGNDNAENAEYKFCDAAQLGLALNAKESILKKVIDTKVKDMAPEQCAASCEGENCKNSYKNSKELYRWALESIKVKDDSADGADKFIYFFKAAAGGFVEDDKAIKEIVGFVNNIADKDLEKADYKAHLDYLISTENGLDSINKSANRDAVLILLNKDKFGTLAENEKWIDEIGTNYAITFNEFYAAFKETVKQYKEGGARVGKEEMKAVDLPVNGRITITVASLNKILKSKESVIVGITGKDNLDKDTKEKLMKDGKLKEGIDLQGYPNLLELYKDLVEFESYLIKDGYSADYRNDFAKVYGEKDSTTGVKFSEWKFKADNKDDGILSDSGLFSVENNYDWSAEARKISIGIAKAKVLSEIKAEYAQNSLLLMPLDGKLGYEGSREGYGSAYRGIDDRRLFLNTIGTSAVDDKSVSIKTLGGSGIISPNVTLVSEKKFQPSRILEMGQSSIVFAPSDPVYIKVVMNSTATQQGNAQPNSQPASSTANRLPIYDSQGRITGYQETGSRQPTGSQPSGRASTGGSSGMVYTWNMAENAPAEWSIANDGKVTEKTMSPSSLCLNASNDQRTGFTLNSQGNVELGTIVYAPTDVIGNIGLSSITVNCITDASGKVTAYDVIAGKQNIVQGIGNVASLNDGKDGDARLREDYSIQKLIEKIKDESQLVCVKPTSASATFYWNPQKIKDNAK